LEAVVSLIDVFANIAILALCAGIPLILVWGSLRGLEKFRRGGTDKADAFEHERQIRKLEAEKIGTKIDAMLGLTKSGTAKTEKRAA
jgi:hypothetical protein